MVVSAGHGPRLPAGWDGSAAGWGGASSTPVSSRWKPFTVRDQHQLDCNGQPRAAARRPAGSREHGVGVLAKRVSAPSGCGRSRCATHVRWRRLSAALDSWRTFLECFLATAPGSGFRGKPAGSPMISFEHQVQGRPSFAARSAQYSDGSAGPSSSPSRRHASRRGRPLAVSVKQARSRAFTIAPRADSARRRRPGRAGRAGRCQGGGEDIRLRRSGLPSSPLTCTSSRTALTRTRDDRVIKTSFREVNLVRGSRKDHQPGGRRSTATEATPGGLPSSAGSGRDS